MPTINNRTDLASLKEEFKWEISKIQLKNISRPRTQIDDLCSLPSQADHGKHFVRWTLLCIDIYVCMYINVEVRGRLYLEIAQKKIKLHIFNGWDTSRDTNHTAPQGPTQAERYVCRMDVPLRAWILLLKRTTKQLGEHSPSGLSTQASTPSKRLLRNC